jgi:hypothetical protein
MSSLYEDQEWVGDISVQRYENGVRVVKPKEGQLVPDSVWIDPEDAEEVADLIRSFAGGGR